MKNLFDVNDLLQDKRKGINVGIQQGVVITTVEKGESPNKNKFIKIEFEKDGGKLSKTLWEPKGSYPQDDETQEDAKLREERANLQIIAKLLKIYLDPETLASFPKLEYEPFIDKAIAALAPKLKEKKVNIKVVYDNNGEYTELSRYGAIEEHIPGEPSNLEFSEWESKNRLTPKRAKKSANDDMEKLLSDDDPFA